MSEGTLGAGSLTSVSFIHQDVWSDGFAMPDFRLPLLQARLKRRSGYYMVKRYSKRG